jgi:nitrite reductase (NADH) small subunit
MGESVLPEMLVNLGNVNKVTVGHGVCFLVGDEEVAVFRQRDGRIFAVQNRCPHRHGPLADGIIGRGQLICPLHAHTFDLQTGQGPAHECLKTYEISIHDEQMLLKLPTACSAVPHSSESRGAE